MKITYKKSGKKFTIIVIPNSWKNFKLGKHCKLSQNYFKSEFKFLISLNNGENKNTMKKILKKWTGHKLDSFIIILFLVYWKMWKIYKN